jgi:hypothetical protein
MQIGLMQKFLFNYLILLPILASLFLLILYNFNKEKFMKIYFYIMYLKDKDNKKDKNE